MSTFDDHVNNALNRALDALKAQVETALVACRQELAQAAADESSRLAKYLKDKEAYRTTFEHMQALRQTEVNEKFLQNAIRVLCGKATATELEEIRALEQQEPEQWRRFQYIRAVLTGVARTAEVEDDLKPEPMPERVRLALATKLRNLKK